MQIIINIEKRHLVFFALFLIAVAGIFYVQAVTTVTPNPGHSLASLGPGLLELDNGANKVFIQSTNDPTVEFVYLGPSTNGDALDVAGNLLVKPSASVPQSTIIITNAPTVGGTQLCIDASGKVGKC